MSHIDLMELCARRKIGMPDTWQAFRWQRKGDYIIVTGAVVTETFKRGPRKGRPKWSARDPETEMPVTVHDGEFSAFKLAWEAETGLCHRCQGTGKVMKSWSVADGTTYRECDVCSGTGKPKAAQEAA